MLDGGADGAGSGADAPVTPDASAVGCAGSTIASLWLGHRDSCYLDSDGARWCWGENTDGVLGLGHANTVLVPTQADDGGGWDKIFLQYYGRSYGVRGDKLWEWGPGATLSPTLAGDGSTLAEVVGDLYSQCFWYEDGTVPACDGGSGFSFRSFAAGTFHQCGVKADDSLYCWGTDRDGALGPVASDTPVQIPGAWRTVGVGSRVNPERAFTCALDTSGNVWCWGNPLYTGTAGVNVAGTPTRIDVPDVGFEWLQVDWERSCAGTAAGNVYCWGADTYGGFVVPLQASAPSPVKLGTTYLAFAVGGHHACGLTSAGWECFGWNEHGELGNGTTVNDGQISTLCH